MTVPEIPGVFTQARQLDEVADVVIDAVRTMQEAAELQVAVRIVAEGEAESGAKRESAPQG